MAHDSDHLDDIPSLVPERDELVSHRNKQRRGSASAASAAAPVYAGEVVARTSGFVTFLLTVLFLGLCGTAAAGYLFFTKGQESQANFERALTRIEQLENRLNLVDEASVQSSTGLLERVNTNFSEIDKLWAARNQLRTSVEGLTNKMAEVEKSSKAMETAIGSQATLINENTNQVKTISQNVERINQNFSGMENLGSQLTTLNADLNRVKTAMDQVQSDVSSRLNASEQDIESINMFRLQVNQSLQAMQENVNRLQQRVGQ
jgi:DNA repair exonuclease SbcCD ATPase subunit